MAGLEGMFKQSMPEEFKPLKPADTLEQEAALDGSSAVPGREMRTGAEAVEPREGARKARAGRVRSRRGRERPPVPSSDQHEAHHVGEHDLQQMLGQLSEDERQTLLNSLEEEHLE